jgi:hypothetical protein
MISGDFWPGGRRENVKQSSLLVCWRVRKEGSGEEGGKGGTRARKVKGGISWRGRKGGGARGREKME